jgi:hypothetical protein
MNKKILVALFIVINASLTACSKQNTSLPAQITNTVNNASIPSPTPVSKPTALPTSAPTPTEVVVVDPFAQVSQEQLFSYLTELTSIQAYSGWRTSATTGEAEAFDYLSKTLSSFPFLNELGMEMEQQSFQVFSSTEFWETTLEITRSGQSFQIPANGILGSRTDLKVALRFDSDGKVNDTETNPLSITGLGVVVRSAEDIKAFKAKELSDKIVFLDYETIFCNDDDCSYDSLISTSKLLEKKPLGIVIVTQFSEQDGDSHGTFVGEDSVISYIEHNAKNPNFIHTI